MTASFLSMMAPTTPPEAYVRKLNCLVALMPDIVDISDVFSQLKVDLFTH
jgi:hypothetical protein